MFSAANPDCHPATVRFLSEGGAHVSVYPLHRANMGLAFCLPVARALDEQDSTRLVSGCPSECADLQPRQPVRQLHDHYVKQIRVGEVIPGDANNHQLIGKLASRGIAWLSRTGTLPECEKMTTAFGSITTA